MGEDCQTVTSVSMNIQLSAIIFLEFCVYLKLPWTVTVIQVNFSYDTRQWELVL